MEEINNFQQELDENLYQAWERFKELLMKCPQHYLTEMQEVILFYNGLGIPTRQILDSRGAIPSKTAADAKVAIQEMAEYSHMAQWNIKLDANNVKDPITPKISHSKKLTTRNLVDLFKEGDIEQQLRDSIKGTTQILPSTDAAFRNQGALIKSLEIQIGQMSKVLQERGFESQPSSTEANPRDQVKSISTTIEFDSCPIRRIRSNQTMKYPKGIAENVLVGIGKFVFPVDFIILDMSEDIKVPLILGRPFLSNAHAKIDVYKGKITLRVGEERIVFTSVKPASSLIKRVYMLSLRKRMDFDLEARLMGDTLVRNQGDDLKPTIKKGEVIEEFRTRNNELDTKINDYPSYCDYDKKIHIDCAHKLKFSCMIGFEFTHANFFLLLYVNVMSKEFHNSIIKDKMVYKGNNVIGALMNVPIFVGTFSVVTDFAVLENVDAYRDERMGDAIFGKPFLRKVEIKAKRFEGMITIYNGDNEVTYQMVRSHPRFKHHTNEQCNKIPSLLKVSDEEKKNGISHSYQKIKGFYKGVLNLGPDYIRNAKMEECLTRRHISVHEME
ncbi:homeodomain-like protein [Tanacetum coccineum]